MYIKQVKNSLVEYRVSIKSKGDNIRMACTHSTVVYNPAQENQRHKVASCID